MDQREFTDFYNETAAGLRRYIRRVAGDADAVDDLLQESYLRFLRAHPGVSEPGPMKAYLYRTATAAIYDRWRRQRRERLWSLSFRWREESAPAPETGDVSRCFQKLKPQQRALLWLAYVEGSSHSEIALALGLAEKSIKVLLFRARRNLEALLEQDGLGALVKTEVKL
jgi:RNA polymerase sigma-70 factor, ECF subfamily